MYLGVVFPVFVDQKVAWKPKVFEKTRRAQLWKRPENLCRWMSDHRDGMDNGQMGKAQ